MLVWIRFKLCFPNASTGVYTALNKIFGQFLNSPASFIRTNQSEVLNTPNLPAVVDGMRKICALESTLLGNVSESNGEVTPAGTTPPATPTSGVTQRSDNILWGSSVAFLLITLSMNTLC